MITNSHKANGCSVTDGYDQDQSLINEILLSLGREYFSEFYQQRDTPGLDYPLSPLACCQNIAALSQFDLSELNVPYKPAVEHVLDVNAVRRDFPILSEKIDGKNLVWFDNAATTQKPRPVIERIKYFYEHENSNVHRAAHTLAARTTDAYESARSRVASFLHAASTDEIVFVRGTTEGINLVAQTYGLSALSRDDEVVLSLLEHHANIVPWQMVCARTGARIKVIPVDEGGQIDLSEYRKLLSAKTKIVAFTHVSNSLGILTPAAEMVHMAHQYGAKVLIDGAQAVAHRKVDVRELDCDFYVFSGHKVFGPTGVGVLYAKAAILNSMQPYQGGGSMIEDVTFDNTTYKKPPHRFEAGTGSIADAIGLAAALDYITGIGLKRISEYEHFLYMHGEEALRSINGLTLIGDAEGRTSILPFVSDRMPPEEIGAILNKEGIAVRTGHHCAQPILRKFGHESTVRISLALYNTINEIDFLVSVLRRKLMSSSCIFPF
jgi:cysteine desulfurase/selenocysteine lyase